MSSYLKRSRKKLLWHFQFSICDHWYLQLTLYFLHSPGNTCLSASMTLFSSTAAHPQNLLYITAPSRQTPLGLGTDSCFLSPNPETSMVMVTCPPSKVTFNSQGFNLQVLAHLFWLCRRVPAMFQHLSFQQWSLESQQGVYLPKDKGTRLF